MPSLPTIQPDDVALAERSRGAGAFDAPVEPNHDPALFDWLLRLGDDALILGQRLSEWCGHAPALEIDLSLANMGLDLIGQATLFLTLAGEVEGRGRDADRLAFHRDVLAWRNCMLVEQPNGDFARTIARHFLFATFQHAYLDALARSADGRVAAVAAKGVKELAYHAELSADWVMRLGDGTAESRARMADAFDWLWRFVDELFEMDVVETGLAARGVTVDRAALRSAFDARVAAVLADATLDLPQPVRAVLGGRRGHHSEHLGHLLALMQHLPRSYPDAAW